MGHTRIRNTDQDQEGTSLRRRCQVRNRRAGALPAAILLLAGSSFLHAQPPSQEDLAAELANILDSPVEGASKYAQRAIESPQAVEVITADQIRMSGAFRIADILRMATSVQVWDAAGERASVTLRGVSPAGLGATVQILIDGVPLFNAVAEPIDLNGLPVTVDSIEKVEIVRGPSSSLYGANAQMGVIAITTRKTASGVAGSLRAGAADKGMFREEGFLSYGEGTFTLTAGGAGYSNRDRGRPLALVGPASGSLPFRDAERGSQAYLRAGWAPWEGGKLWLAYGYGDTGHYDQLAMAPLGQSPLATFPGVDTTREILQAGWSQVISPTLSTELKVDQKAFNLNVDPLAPVAGSPSSTMLVQELEAVDPALATTHAFLRDRIRRVSIQTNWNPCASVHVVGGGDASRIIVGANPILGLAQEESYSASGGFLSLDWKIGQVTVSGGGRLANETLGGTSTSPRFSAVWSLDETTVIRAGIFTSTRSPMAQEKKFAIPANPVVPYDLVANPVLKAEKTRDYEVGFRKIWKAFSLDLTCFRTDIQRTIALRPESLSADGTTNLAYQNAPTTHAVEGVELALTAEPAPGLLLGWNGSTATFKDPINGLDQQADYSPKGQSSLWARYRKSIYFAYAGVQTLASYSVNVPGTGERQTLPPSTQVHFNLGVNPVPDLSLSVYGNNAAKESTSVTNMGLVNQNALRYSRRELGIQAGLKF